MAKQAEDHATQMDQLRTELEEARAALQTVPMVASLTAEYQKMSYKEIQPFFAQNMECLMAVNSSGQLTSAVEIQENNIVCVGVGAWRSQEEWHNRTGECFRHVHGEPQSL